MEDKQAQQEGHQQAQGGAPPSPTSSSSTPPSPPPPQFYAVPKPEDEHEAALPKVQRNGRLYRTKKANLPFLKRHTWETKQKSKDSDSTTTMREKESSPPVVVERTTQVSRTLFRYLAVIVLGTLLLSRAMTETWTFGYRGRWSNVMNYIPRPMQTFSESELLKYDGSDPSLPIYLAIDEVVYDVSTNPRMYGKGASYNHFAGRDGARAFVTGCFKTHLTHDVRGFSEKEQKALDGWKSFFNDHAKYYKVGKVVHEPIPNDAPLPAPCDPKAEGGAR